MKDIFGKPGEGLHKYRFGNVAWVDTIITITFAYIIAYFTSVPLTLLIIIFLLLAIVLHWLFCVPTSVNKYIGIA